MRMMTLLITGTVALAGCGEGGGQPEGRAKAPAKLLSKGPMPDLSVRLQDVERELGPLLPMVRQALPVVNGVLASSRRDALDRVGPVCRASMRRHAVTVEQLARHLGGTDG